jgi:histidinol-phosphate aminotransferase
VTVTAAEMLVRQHVRALRPVVHGSVSAAELAQFGLSPDQVLDFSVNTNPLGPAPVVKRAVQSTDWTRYPGDDEAPLRQALAYRAGVASEQVALGNGSAELLWLIALTALREGDPVTVVGPTFGEYARAALTLGAHVREVLSLEHVPSARMVFVCNPNNPTGTFHGRAEIEQLLAGQPDRVVVLDEAYASFADNRWRAEPLLDQYPNLVILRSLTKDHALPGVRLGYALAAPELAAALEAVRPPWSVNAGALRAGLAMFEPDAEAHVAAGRATVTESRRLLTRGLTELGFRVSPSMANFVLVEVGDGAAFRRVLLPHGIVVRDCASFGLPAHVRIACRLPEHCQTLLDLVQRLRHDDRLPTALRE